MINTIGLIEKYGPVAASIIAIVMFIYLQWLFFSSSGSKEKKTVSFDDDEDFNNYEEDDEEFVEKSSEIIDMTEIYKNLYSMLQQLFNINSYGVEKSIVCYNDGYEDGMYRVTTVLFPNDIFYLKIDYDVNSFIHNEMNKVCSIKLHHDTKQAEIFRSENDYSAFNHLCRSDNIQLCNALHEILEFGVVEDYGY